MLLACTVAARTEVIVSIDAEPGVRAAAPKLHVVVLGGEGSVAGATATRLDRVLRPGTADPGYPLRVAVAPLGGDATRIYEVTAVALAEDESFVAGVRAVSGFVPGRTLELHLLLEDACRGQVCGETETCSAGVCHPADVAPEMLPNLGADASAASPDGGGSLDANATDSGDDADVPVDANARDDSAARDAGGPAPTCDATDSSLVACFEFEGNGLDGSSYGNNAAATAVTYVTGVEGMAVQTSASSGIVVPSTASLRVSALTIEAWIRPDSLPSAGARMVVLDKQQGYIVALYPGGQAECFALPPAIAAAAIAPGIVTGVWQHIACTADGTTTRIFLNGHLAGSGGALMSYTYTDDPVQIGEDSPTGGDQFLGALDSVRLWNRVRSDAEICLDSGSSGCP